MHFPLVVTPSNINEFKETFQFKYSLKYFAFIPQKNGCDQSRMFPQKYYST